MTFLCDTNIISELTRPHPNVGVIAWASQVTQLRLSVISVEEIAFGLAAKPNVRIQKWFESFLELSCEVVPINKAIAQQAGKLRGQLQAKGKPRTQADMMIAATAYIHHLTLVTRNVRDFDDCDISLLNPFS
jgi:toxin FitB